MKKYHSDGPSFLKKMCEYKWNLNPVIPLPLPLSDKQTDGTFSFTLKRAYKKFAGLKLEGKKAILQTIDGDVNVYFPQYVFGLCVAHAHTDVRPFLHAVPNSECFVSPVVEVHCTSEQQKCRNKERFRIRVRHCLKNKDDFRQIRVRQGNIHK